MKFPIEHNFSFFFYIKAQAFRPLNYSFISLDRFSSNHVFAIIPKCNFPSKKNVSLGSEMCTQYLYYGIFKGEKEIFNLINYVCFQEVKYKKEQ